MKGGERGVPRLAVLTAPQPFLHPSPRLFPPRPPIALPSPVFFKIFDFENVWSRQLLFSNMFGLENVRCRWFLMSMLFYFKDLWSLTIPIWRVLDLENNWSRSALISRMFELDKLALNGWNTFDFEHLCSCDLLVSISFWYRACWISEMSDLEYFRSPNYLIAKMFDAGNCWSWKCLISGTCVYLYKSWCATLLISNNADGWSVRPRSRNHWSRKVMISKNSDLESCCYRNVCSLGTDSSWDIDTCFLDIACASGT